MSKILANEIANYGDDAPIDLKEGLNIPAGKPIQAAGSTGTTGQVLSTTGTSIQWVTPFSGSYTDLTNKPTIPSAQVNADWNSSSGVSAILNKPVVPPLSSVVTASAGTAALSFNSANGQFTYTPPDLSSFATTTSLTTAVANSSNWDTAFGWGDHAQAGYLTTETSTFSQVLDRSKSTLAYYGSYANLVTTNSGSNNVHFQNMVQFSNDVQCDMTGDRWNWGSYSGAITWCGSGGDPLGNGPNTSITDWGNRQFELIHWDANRPFDASIGYGISGALYLKSLQGGTISIGSDTGTIQLGNNNGSVKYLEASATSTSLFLNNALKLKTVSNGIEVTGRTYYNNSFTSSDLDVSLATSWPSMFVVASDTNKPYVSFNNQWNELLLTSSSIDGLADVDTTTVAPQNGQVLKWNGAKWAPANDLTGGGGGGLALTDLSASTATASGGGAFAYNNGTGVFTYTPPDLSNYDTAFGWGNHASAGYITSIGDAIQDADFTTNGLMKRTAAGTYTSTTDNSSNWDTAFGWGDHGSQGYLTSLPAHGIGNHNDVTVTSPQDNQLLKYNNSLAQWENWTPNYLTSIPATISGAKTFSGSTTFSENVDFEGNPDGGAALSMQFYKGDGTNADLDTLKFFNRSGITIGAGETGGFTMRHWSNNSSYILTNGDSFFIDGGTSTAIKIRTQFARNAIVCNSDNGGTGTVELYHSASGTATKKFETTSAGASVYGQLTAGGLTYPTSNGNSGQILTSDGAGNVTWQDGGSGNTQVSISDTIPAGSASAGDLWWESDTGRLKIYYQDTDSAQWVDVNPPLRQDRIASTGAPSSATDTGVAGDIRYDSGYVYIAVGTNTWKRAALTTW